MDRRRFLRNSALIAAGVVAADSLDLLERLEPRRLFAAWPTPPKLWGDGIHDDTAALQWMLDHGDRYVGGGYYRTTAPLYFRSNSSIVFTTIVSESQGSVLEAHNVVNARLGYSCVQRSRSARHRHGPLLVLT